MNAIISRAKEKYIFFSASIIVSIFFLSIAQAHDDTILEAINAEVQRTMGELKLPGSLSPYFASCSLHYSKKVNANAISGLLIEAADEKEAEQMSLF